MSRGGHSSVVCVARWTRFPIRVCVPSFTTVGYCSLTACGTVAAGSSGQLMSMVSGSVMTSIDLAVSQQSLVELVDLVALLELPVELVLVELEVDDFVLLLFNPTIIPAINWALPAYVIFTHSINVNSRGVMCSIVR